MRLGKNPQMNEGAASIHETLKSVFGFDNFREGQEPVIRQLLSGNSALAVFPTGSGKSLCYQLTALHLKGVTIVISPLIALMKDQVEFLREHQIAAARVDSTIKFDELRQIDADLQSGTLKLLYVAPERFSNERFVQKLRRLEIAMMVIDEAHCISEWGHNFRPDYLKLAREARKLNIPQVLALTATATPGVAADICREFAIQPEAFIHTGFYRPNLTLRVTPCPAKEQSQILLRRLREHRAGPTIVYVTLQKTAEDVATELRLQGFTARAYHAGMESDERDAVQDWFMDSRNAIVVATIAFGMGIDKSDIRYVYHYNLPKSLENYSQEIGRAGRDGKESVCEILACGDDMTVLENFTFGDTPEAHNVAAIVEMVLRHDGDFDISVYEVSRRHDVRPLVVNTLMTYLELADVIEATAPFYSEYQFQPLKPFKEILARFDAERADFLRSVFAYATKARTWFSIDLESTAVQLQTTRDRLVKAFTYLEESGDLTLKVAGLRQGYRIKQRPQNPSALKRSLVDRFETRELKDIERMNLVMELVNSQSCLVRKLLSYFGEDLVRDCGHCGPCAGEPAGSVRRTARLAKLDLTAVAAVREQHPKALATPRQIARFLCGITSPLLTQSKLSRHALFGSQAGTPFHEVMAAVAPLVGEVREEFPEYGEAPGMELNGEEAAPF